ncbi:hypothetical protein H7F33_16965 [Pedobacter sp. PAMC26386]|nr:hypothetical protein H7F33_16965 [Pedobacter sp. PAMC26386]
MFHFTDNKNLSVLFPNLNIPELKKTKLDLISSAHAHNLVKDTKAGVNYGMIPVNSDGSINVRLSANDIINVQLKGINRSGLLSWDSIKIKQD